MAFNVKQHIPIIDWLGGYPKKYLSGDIIAGITVGIMLIPQSMAYAMVAGLPAIYGLYTAFIPLFVYAIFGTSRQMGIGPAAMVSLLIAASVERLQPNSVAEYINYALVLTALVGIVQFTLGLLRLGFLVNFLSRPIINGYTSAVALIIGFNQFKHLIGIDLDRSNYIHNIILQIVNQFGEINVFTLCIGVVAILIIYFLKKRKKRFVIPPPLLVVAIGIGVVWLFKLSANGVSIIGTIPQGLPQFTIPIIKVNLIIKMLPYALTIALLGFLDCIAIGKTMQAKHRDYKLVANQELIALGLTNFIASFFQAYSVSGSFSRSAVNDQSGAKTQLSTIIAAVLIALTLLFLTPLFYFLPKAVLAAIIVVSVFGLIDIKEPIYLWENSKTDFFMLLITFIGTLSLGVKEGIAVGVVLSLAMVIFRSTQPHFAVIGRIPNTSYYRNKKRYPNAVTNNNVLIVRFDAQLYFANVAFFKDKLEEFSTQKGKDLQLIILDASSIHDIDASGMHALKEVVETYKQQDIQFYITGAIGPVRDVLYRSDFLQILGQENYFMRIEDAMKHYTNEEAYHAYKKRTEYTKITLQTNEDSN